MKKLKKQKLYIAMQNFNILLFVILSLLSVTIYSQEVKTTTFYSCRDCKIEKIIRVGENTVLSFSTYNNGNFLYLLNNNNLFVDTIKLISPQGLYAVDSNEFIIPDLNIPMQFIITDNQFRLKSKKIFISSKFTFKNFMVSFVLDGKYWGMFKNNKTTLCYFDINDYPKIQMRSKIINNDTIFTLLYNKRKNINTDILPHIVVDKETIGQKRTNYSFGFNSFGFSSNNIFFFDIVSQSFYIVERASNTMKEYFRLPINNERNDSWNYFYDNIANKHYFLKRSFAKVDEKEKYELFLFNINHKNLQFVCQLNYIPNLISNRDVYRIIENNENGFDILRFNISDIITKTNRKIKISESVDVE